MVRAHQHAAGARTDPPPVPASGGEAAEHQAEPIPADIPVPKGWGGSTQGTGVSGSLGGASLHFTRQMSRYQAAQPPVDRAFELKVK